MSWRYRVIRHKDSDDSFYFQIHEVYSNESGRPKMFSEDGIAPMGRDLEKLKHDLEYMAKALESPVLDHDELLAMCKSREEEVLPLEKVIEDIYN